MSRRCFQATKQQQIIKKQLNQIKSFLRNRSQRFLGEIESDWRDILTGVPQGSVLRPLLFVIYINDLPDGLKSIFKMYADESKVISESGPKQLVAMEEMTGSQCNKSSQLRTWQNEEDVPVFNIKLFKILYPTFIRLHLEFAAYVENIFPKENIRKWNVFNKRATNMVIQLRAMSYDERLKALGSTTLEV